MRSRLLQEAGGQRTFSIVLETDDEVMACLKAFATRERLSASQFTAIGSFRRAVLGYFEWERKDYRRNPIEQVEVASLVGDVALGQGGEPDVHAVLGRRDGSAVAGHLLEGHVRPTLEVVLTESPAHLRKRHDPESGLALVNPVA